MQGGVCFCEAWRMSGGRVTNSDNAGQGGEGESENPSFGRTSFVNGPLCVTKCEWPLMCYEKILLLYSLVNKCLQYNN